MSNNISSKNDYQTHKETKGGGDNQHEHNLTVEKRSRRKRNPNEVDMLHFINPDLSPEEKTRRAETLFSAIDKENNGYVTPQKMIFHHRRANVSSGKDLFKEIKIFQLFDLNGDSMVTREEFIASLLACKNDEEILSFIDILVARYKPELVNHDPFRSPLRKLTSPVNAKIDDETFNKIKANWEEKIRQSQERSDLRGLSPPAEHKAQNRSNMPHVILEETNENKNSIMDIESPEFGQSNKFLTDDENNNNIHTNAVMHNENFIRNLHEKVENTHVLNNQNNLDEHSEIYINENSENNGTNAYLNINNTSNSNPYFVVQSRTNDDVNVESQIRVHAECTIIDKEETQSSNQSELNSLPNKNEEHITHLNGGDNVQFGMEKNEEKDIDLQNQDISFLNDTSLSPQKTEIILPNQDSAESVPQKNDNQTEIENISDFVQAPSEKDKFPTLSHLNREASEEGVLPPGDHTSQLANGNDMESKITDDNDAFTLDNFINFWSAKPPVSNPTDETKPHLFHNLLEWIDKLNYDSEAKEKNMHHIKQQKDRKDVRFYDDENEDEICFACL